VRVPELALKAFMEGGGGGATGRAKRGSGR
jgi:hypothetical protein